MRSKLFLVCSLLVSLNTIVHAEIERPSVFANDYVYKMAKAYRYLVETKDIKTASEDFEKIMDSSRFFGYVAGALEFEESLHECAKKKNIKEIVYKTSVVLDSITRNDKAPSFLLLVTGVEVACNDSIMNK